MAEVNIELYWGTRSEDLQPLVQKTIEHFAIVKKLGSAFSFRVTCPHNSTARVGASHHPADGLSTSVHRRRGGAEVAVAVGSVTTSIVAIQFSRGRD